ncbi:MAG: nucleotidyltransferase domain-containing protein [Bryobacteraceae bacterium]
MDDLKEIVSKLERALGARLVSVILYGSAASENHREKFSDVNLLCVLKEIGVRELADTEPVLRWWHDKGHPAPTLMSEEEVRHSADCFPIEFRDMKDRRKVLYGPDAIAEVKVDGPFYRAQVEHELRAKLFRLRQQGARVLSDPAALMKLCLESVSTFCVLGRHALVAAGIGAKAERRAVVHQLSHTLKMDTTPFELLLDLREDKAGPEIGDPGELFARYLECVRKMIEFVDGLEARQK